jgi:hypothetical protein
MENENLIRLLTAAVADLLESEAGRHRGSQTGDYRAKAEQLRKALQESSSPAQDSL